MPRYPIGTRNNGVPTSPAPGVATFLWLKETIGWTDVAHPTIQVVAGVSGGCFVDVVTTVPLYGWADLGPAFTGVERYVEVYICPNDWNSDVPTSSRVSQSSADAGFDASAKDATVAHASDLAGLAQESTLLLVKSKTDAINWANVTDLHDEAFGKWDLNPDTGVLTLYRTDKITVLATFDLPQAAGIVPAFIGRVPR